MTDATNPTAPATQAPAAATASDTIIKLDGKEVELKGITVEQTTAMYEALPAEYKHRADAYAKIAKNIERVIKDLPAGMSVGKAWEEYTQAFDSTGKFIKDGSKPWLEKFHAAVEGTPLAALRTGDSLAEIMGSAKKGVGAGISDATGAVGNFGKLLEVLGAEVKGATKDAFGIATVSDAQAKALGTVFAAAEFHESAVRQGLPVLDASLNNLVVKYPLAAAGAAAEHATASVPIASDVWSYIVAAAKFVMNLFSNAFGENADKNLPFFDNLAKAWEKTSYSASLAEARGEQAAKNPSLSFGERLEARVKAGETERAAAKLEAAQVEQKLNVPEGTVAAANGKAPFVAPNGTLNQTTPDASGKPEVKPVLGADGKPVDRVERIVGAAAGVFPETTKALKEGDPTTIAGVAAGTALAGAAGYQVARGGLEGAVRTYTGHDAKLADNAAKDAAKLDAKATRMETGQKHFFERKADPDALREQARALRAKAVPHAAAAEDIAAGVKHLAGSDNRAAAMVGKLVEGATEKHSNWNVLRNGGRLVGDAFGGTMNVMRSSVATFVTDAAPIVAGLGKGAATVAKFARAIPGVGVVAGGGMMAFAASAHADTVDGEKLSYFKQLDHDHKQGKVTDKEYAYYRSLQTGYVASGLGGLATAGVSEVVKVSLENMDPVKMDKYLPESLVSTVKGLVAGDTPTGVLGAPDKGLEAAAVAATQKAEQARIAQVVADSATDIQRARMAANRTPFAKTQVQLGSTVTGMPAPTGNLPQGNTAQASLPPMA